MLGLLKPDLAVRFNWSEAQYSYIVVVFTACYAIGMVLSGKLVDRVGVKIGYGVCVLVWSIAACGHALVRSTLGFGVMRALLGISESGSFPCAVKSVSEWFPRKEQALAVGILTSGYFNSRFHLDMKNLGLPLIIVYTATSIGSIGGGWISSKLIARGWPVSKARQMTMLGLAFLVVPIAFSPWIENMWAMVGLLSLAAAAHQGWSANLFTIPSDMFLKELVGSVVGIGGLAGALGATLFPLLVGAILDHFKVLGNINAGYNVLFVICGSAYIVAWVVMRIIRSSQTAAELLGLVADSTT